MTGQPLGPAQQGPSPARPGENKASTRQEAGRPGPAGAKETRTSNPGQALLVAPKIGQPRLGSPRAIQCRPAHRPKDLSPQEGTWDRDRDWRRVLERRGKRRQEPRPPALGVQPAPQPSHQVKIRRGIELLVPVLRRSQLTQRRRPASWSRIAPPFASRTWQTVPGGAADAQHACV
jgi:hypothetical protein